MLFITYFFFFFQAEDGIRDLTVTGVQTCALPVPAPIPGAAADRAGDGIAVDSDAADRRDRTVSRISHSKSLYDDISARDRHHAECVSQRWTDRTAAGDPGAGILTLSRSC